jgi:hypothetical protein
MVRTISEATNLHKRHILDAQVRHPNGLSYRTLTPLDERGWEPSHQPIISSNTDLTHSLKSRLNLKNAANSLTAKGFQVILSTDPGRFVCNWI